jgi:tetratricopeptide (TPR) repeat protein
MRWLLTTLALAVAAAPAAAQSKRYPPPPPDPDRDADAHSKLWEGALDPGRTPYDALVADAKRLADEHIADSTAEAIKKLGRAIELFPKAPDAYVLRGHLALVVKDWARCAADLEAADDRRHDDGPQRTALEFDLGICAARAGRYALAESALERVLESVAVAGDRRTEAWLRLGEVRIAMGKLEEATSALDTALETGDGAQGLGLMHFLLAAAYDRARRPGDAESEILIAAQYDRAFTSILQPTYPLLGAGEPEYLMGLTYRYSGGTAGPRPEFALVYFRRFLALATDSPWRRRAEDHARELAALEFPQNVERRGGTTMLDLDAAHAALVKAMPAMRACLAKTPTAVFEVEITRDGPLSPISRDKPITRVFPNGTTVRDLIALDNPPRADLDAAAQCVQTIADHAAMPVPKEPDTYYKAAFQVAPP